MSTQPKAPPNWPDKYKQQKICQIEGVIVKPPLSANAMVFDDPMTVSSISAAMDAESPPEPEPIQESGSDKVLVAAFAVISIVAIFLVWMVTVVTR